MWQLPFVVATCVLIVLMFGCGAGTPLGIGLVVTLVGMRWFEIHTVRRRRANLPIFGVPRLPSLKLPNRGEILLFAVVGTIAFAVAHFADALPKPE
jgi:hypothetical protein